MKKLKSTLILSGALLFVGNNCFAATTTTTDETVAYTKYIAIAVAAVIIILLLFLGFKMDSKESDETIVKQPKKSKKVDKVAQAAENESTKYEEDSVSYENDSINLSDLSEVTEYEEDEDSLFDSINDDDNENISNDLYEEPDESEDYGEEFDTSVIDNIEDEDDIIIPEKTSDKTMVFNNPPASKTAMDEEDDKLLNEIDEELAEEMNEADPLMDELKKVNTSGSKFGGFSVSNQPKEKVEEEVKENSNDEDINEKMEGPSITEEDFFAQMEENLKKGKEERDANNAFRKKK